MKGYCNMKRKSGGYYGWETGKGSVEGREWLAQGDQSERKFEGSFPSRINQLFGTLKQ